MDRFKQFNKGLEQLQEEGVIQVLYAQDQMRREPILAAVGQLQFDVVMARLQAEYNVEAVLDGMSYSEARWVVGAETDIAHMYLPSQSLRARDHLGRTVILFSSAWDVKYAVEKNPSLKICTITEAWELERSDR